MIWHIDTMLCENNFKNCRSVLSVYVTINSVCWTLIDRAKYEVVEWKYHGIDYPESKRFQITDILDIVCTFPYTCIYLINNQCNIFVGIFLALNQSFSFINIDLKKVYSYNLYN